jgi:hypothetical protein
MGTHMVVLDAKGSPHRAVVHGETSPRPTLLFLKNNPILHAINCSVASQLISTTFELCLSTCLAFATTEGPMSCPASAIDCEAFYVFIKHNVS